MEDECAMVNGSISQKDAACFGAESLENRNHSSTRPRPYPVGGPENDSTAVPLESSESPSLRGVASGGTHGSSSAACLQWPDNDQLTGSADERAACFSVPQKSVEAMYSAEAKPCGQQATTLLHLMTIRAFHSKSLRRCSLGTALGFRTTRGEITSIPAIIVFVARKVQAQWLHDMQILPAYVEGPGGIWCDIDVVEVSYYGTPAMAPKEQIYTELVDGLRGMDACIGSGTQVASQETYGTLGAIVQSQTGHRQLGFITNRHVAVDLDYPSQKMFHPLPPNLGPGVYLGAVERAASFVKDDLWYGVFAGMNPETFVKADGAFIPFTESFDTSMVTTSMRGVGSIGDVMRVDLEAEIGSIVGRQVVKVGRSSGVTKGIIMSYAVEFNDEKGVCFFTDFLIVGENNQMFDLEGDSGSLILLTYENDAQKPRPVGLIWGGIANRGRLKLQNEHGPQNWTSGVDLGRLLDILQLDIITSNEALQEAIALQEHIMAVMRRGSPRWLAPSPSKKGTIHQPPTGARDPEVTCLPAAKDLLSLASIGDSSLSRTSNTSPARDLAEDDLSMRPLGPSSVTQKGTQSSGTLSLSGPVREKGSREPPSQNDIDKEEIQYTRRRGNKARKV